MFLGLNADGMVVSEKDCCTEVWLSHHGNSPGILLPFELEAGL